MTEPVDPNPETGSGLARRARELVYGRPKADDDDEPEVVEAEIIDDENAEVEPFLPQFQNNFYGGAPGQIIQVKGNINNLRL